jgi:hypothetical protein
MLKNSAMNVIGNAYVKHARYIADDVDVTSRFHNIAAANLDPKSRFSGAST